MNARANNRGIFYPIIPSERIKTRAMLDIRHAQFGDQQHPARRSARYFRLSEQAQNISVFQSRWKSRSFLCMNAPKENLLKKESQSDIFVVIHLACHGTRYVPAVLPAIPVMNSC